MLTTRTWMERSVSAVAFDGFIFGHDVLCTEPADGDDRGALERGTRNDDVVLAVGSMPWRAADVAWIGVQSKRSANHLELDELLDGSIATAALGHAAFDAAFDLDVDDELLDSARAVLTDDWCDWLVEADRRDGPLIVVFDGPDTDDSDTDDAAAIYLAREVSGDKAFVETMAITAAAVAALPHPAPS